MQNIKRLNRKEMRQIKGGGTCCAHTADWSLVQCGLTKAEAESAASNYHIYWCCDSCPATHHISGS